MMTLEMREAVTGTLFVLDLVLFTFLAWYLVSCVRLGGWRYVYGKVENQAAFGLLTLIFGLGIIRAWSLFLLWLQEHGYGIAWELEQRYPVALGGLAIAVVGKVCIIRVFSKESWGHWGWIGGLAISAVFVAALLGT